MIGSKRYILAIPIISLVIGGTALLYGYWEHRNDIDEIKILFDAHVDSVAALVEEGAREASISTALLYELAEEDALKSIKNFALGLPGTSGEIELHDVDHWRVQLVIRDNDNIAGVWGPVPEAEWKAFVAQMQNAPRDEMLDDDLVGKFGLFCMTHEIENGFVVICRDNAWLSDLRKEVGIGPLLKGIIKKDVLYVALQDSSGVLAVAPSHEMISGWEEDPDLESANRSADQEGTSRLIQMNGHTVFEGLIPFEMADESMVLLRVGIDAAVLNKVKENSHRRYLLMLLLILGITVLVIILTGAAWRWQNKKEDIENILAKKEAEQQHWETVGQLAATVAHEVRNPLSTMKMIAQRLGREFNVTGDVEQGEFAEMLEMLGSESDRVNRVVTGFLDLGKPLNLNLQKTELSTAIEEAIWPMTVRTEKENKTLRIENMCDIEMNLDPERFKQLMANVVENALDSLDGGGKVVIRAERSDTAVKIFVEDSGKGLSEEQLLEVMKPFVSFKSNGTGLGLPLVQRLAELHGGSFKLTSTLGMGTTACITLPFEMDN